MRGLGFYPPPFPTLLHTIRCLSIMRRNSFYFIYKINKFYFCTMVQNKTDPYSNIICLKVSGLSPNVNFLETTFRPYDVIFISKWVSYVSAPWHRQSLFMCKHNLLKSHSGILQTYPNVNAFVKITMRWFVFYYLKNKFQMDFYHGTDKVDVFTNMLCLKFSMQLLRAQL